MVGVDVSVVYSIERQEMKGIIVLEEVEYFSKNIINASHTRLIKSLKSTFHEMNNYRTSRRKEGKWSQRDDGTIIVMVLIMSSVNMV